MASVRKKPAKSSPKFNGVPGKPGPDCPIQLMGVDNHEGGPIDAGRVLVGVVDSAIRSAAQAFLDADRRAVDIARSRDEALRPCLREGRKPDDATGQVIQARWEVWYRHALIAQNSAEETLIRTIVTWGLNATSTDQVDASLREDTPPPPATCVVCNQHVFMVASPDGNGLPSLAYCPISRFSILIGDTFVTGPKPNTRDTSRKVAASISQKSRKAKESGQNGPFEPGIGFKSREIS